MIPGQGERWPKDARFTARSGDCIFDHVEHLAWVASVTAREPSDHFHDKQYDHYPWKEGQSWDADQSWDDAVPPQHADIQLGRHRTRMRLPGNRSLIALSLIGIVTLTACASVVTSTTVATKAPALASTDLSRQVATADPLQNHYALRTGRPLQPRIAAEATPAATPYVAPAKMPQPIEAKLEEAPGTWPSPAILGSRDAVFSRPVTELVAFDSAPFPYDGTQPQGGPFLDVDQDGQRGHRTRRGQVLWESTTFNDRRVLVHIPAGFDPNRPAVLVVFYHGFGATLTRDVLARQKVPAQISASGANAILLAPQFAVDARDASAGRFWQQGGFSRFLKEASRQLAQIQGNPALQRSFVKMPVVLVAYSGGFVAAAWSLKDVAGTNRVRGVLLLDAAYGELDRFADFASSNRSSFLISAYTRYTQRQNTELVHLLEKRGIAAETQMSRSLSRGGAIFLPTGTETSHNDFVTQAWTNDPIKDVLTRLPEFRLHEPRTLAAVDLSRTTGGQDDNGAIQ